MNVGLPCSACGRSHASHVCALCPEPELLCSKCSVATRRGPRCIPHFEQRTRMRLLVTTTHGVERVNDEQLDAMPSGRR